MRADGPLQRAIRITVLIFAGEMIFSLPFHTARFFRPTMLEVFGFTNTHLGDVFAVYGLAAMLSYFPGGMIADRFSPRALLTLSLLLTAAGGMYMATIPGGVSMAILYGYWGVTTIFLFWCALIKASREWGGEMSQGKAFGILDGGRGFVAAGGAVIGVALLAFYLPPDATTAAPEERRAGMQAVILYYSAATAAVALLTWFLIPASTAGPAPSGRDNPLLAAFATLRRRRVWAQAGIVICAYCGYKGLDYYSLYAVKVLGADEVEGARLAAYASYTRPVAAVLAGIIADRFLASRTLAATFGALVLSYGVFAVATPVPGWLPVIYANTVLTFSAVFALRGIYFALLQETGTPPQLTGTTVGIVSFIGFTPEIFFAPIAGRILDGWPGITGHHYFFMFMASVALIGLVIVLALMRLNRAPQAVAMPG